MRDEKEINFVDGGGYSIRKNIVEDDVGPPFCYFRWSAWVDTLNNRRDYLVDGGFAGTAEGAAALAIVVIARAVNDKITGLGQPTEEDLAAFLEEKKKLLRAQIEHAKSRVALDVEELAEAERALAALEPAVPQ